MSRARSDVLVVGGGPAGSTAAFALAGAGFEVTLIDRARFPREKVCGESLSPGAMTRLHRLGLWSDDGPAPRAHWAVSGMRLSTSNGASFVGRYRPGAERAEGSVIRRWDLDQRLLASARARGVRVLEGTEALGGEVQPDGSARIRVRATGGSGEHSLAASRVVVADGRRSFIARQLGLLAREPESPGKRRWAVRAHCNEVGGLSDLAEMHVVAGAYCGIAPLSATSANVSYVLLQPNLDADYGEIEASFRRDLRRFPALADRLRTCQPFGQVRVIGPLRLRAGRHPFNGPFLACGDTTGFLDPFTGEGIAHAIASGAAGADAIAASIRGDRDAFARYEDALRALRRFKGPAALLLHALVARPSLGDLAGRIFARAPRLADAAVRLFGDQV